MRGFSMQNNQQRLEPWENLELKLPNVTPLDGIRKALIMTRNNRAVCIVKIHDLEQQIRGLETRAYEMLTNTHLLPWARAQLIFEIKTELEAAQMCLKAHEGRINALEQELAALLPRSN
jgi:hypothetical protein